MRRIEYYDDMHAWPSVHTKRLSSGVTKAMFLIESIYTEKKLSFYYVNRNFLTIFIKNVLLLV